MHRVSFPCVFGVCLPTNDRHLIVEPRLSAWDELMTTGVYAPRLPIVQSVPFAPINGAEESRTCAKHAKGNTHLGPGVILLWCVEHRCCIGFSIMTKAESPRTLYEVLATRFRVLPAIVIYDNACNVCAYAMNRNPSLFRDTQFLSDALHFPAHTNCAPTFDSARYRHLFTGASVVHEQKNRDLAWLKKKVPHMLFATFAALLVWAVSRLNMQEFAKMDRQVDGADGASDEEGEVELAFQLMLDSEDEAEADM